MNELFSAVDIEGLCQQAIALFYDEKAVSISLLQRRMKIGYSIALNVMDALEQTGMLTKPDSVGFRTLIKND